MSSPYPKKYWWVVLVAVPISVGLIAIIPKFLGGSDGDGNRITIENSKVGGNVQIVGTQLILNQLKSSDIDVADMEKIEASINQAINLVEGGFYEDAILLFEEIVTKAQTPAIYNNLGTLYLLENQNEQAYESFKKGIAIDSTYQPLRLNLGRLYEQEGKIKEAIAQLEKAPDEAEARKLLARLTYTSAAGLFEQEPNNDILSPNDAPVAENIQGVIRAQSDIDFFKFTTPDPPRDIVGVEVKNLSTNLKLRVSLWGSDKQHLWSSATYGHQVTSGQDIRYAFSALPKAVYYLSISSLGDRGKYQLSLLPKGAFDSYEPNDNILTAKDAELGSPINASLMDSNDRDYYRIHSSGNAVLVSLKNNSPDLQPQIQIWRGDKSYLWGNANYGHQVTPSQDVEKSFETERGETYYVSIASLGGSGEYTLFIAQSQ